MKSQTRPEPSPRPAGRRAVLRLLHVSDVHVGAEISGVPTEELLRHAAALALVSDRILLVWMDRVVVKPVPLLDTRGLLPRVRCRVVAVRRPDGLRVEVRAWLDGMGRAPVEVVLAVCDAAGRPLPGTRTTCTADGRWGREWRVSHPVGGKVVRRASFNWCGAPCRLSNRLILRVEFTVGGTAGPTFSVVLPARRKRVSVLGGRSIFS